MKSSSLPNNKLRAKENVIHNFIIKQSVNKFSLSDRIGKVEKTDKLNLE